MKKTSLLLLFSLFTTIIATAQVSILPKIGVNIANVAIDNDNAFENDKKSLTGFTAGLGFNFSLADNDFLSVQPEILYSQKGFAAENNNAIGGYQGHFRFNYLEIPVLLKVNFGGEQIKAYVNVGPSVGFLMNGRVKGDWNVLGMRDNINEPLEFKDNANELHEMEANRTEVGLNFGGGVGYGLGRNILFVDLRYNAGLTDFNQREKSRNQVFAITAGLQIPIR